MTASDYRQLMKELQTEYLASFPEKYAHLKALLDKKDWEGLELEFHKLKGTGKTYGIPEVSKTGYCMEKICKSGETAVTAVFSAALELLEDIRTAYASGNTVDLESDNRYQKISSLAQ